jgi:hypothetical protein
MKRRNPLLYFIGFIPVVLGGLSSIMFYTGIEFAWIAAVASIICFFLVFAAVFVLGRFLVMFLFPALLLAVIADVVIFFFTEPWYMILVISFMCVYALLFLLAVVMNLFRMKPV